jgi:hypothetical protein
MNNRVHALIFTTSTIFFGTTLGAEELTIDVIENTNNKTVLTYEIPSYKIDTVVIKGSRYIQPVLDGENHMIKAGYPALPDVSRAIVIPDVGNPKVRILNERWHEVHDVQVVPSKGNLLRNIDPSTVPYTFGGIYNQDVFWPKQTASIRQPHIIRDIRGVVIDVAPFQYNAKSNVLRVLDSLTLEVTTTGDAGNNTVSPTAMKHSIGGSYKALMENHFVNYQGAERYDPLSDDGDLLVICYDDFLPNIQPFVDHKNSIGIITTVVPISAIGNNDVAIDAYIENVYNSSNLGFVLLVGDAFQIDYPIATAESGAADPMYGQISGNDHYPEVIVGRFSAETGSHVDTQVERTLAYENNQATQQAWYKKATGLASAEGSGIGDDGESDDEHQDNIRLDLLAHGYTEVDQIYDTNGGTSSMVTNAVNAGRGLMNYTGHGSTNTWSTTGFNSSNVNALTNVGMLPWIVSVACLNGQYHGPTCFAESWLRATHNNQPSGAILGYMSSINQSWAPPMSAQDEIVDLFCAETYTKCGVLCMAGSCLMIDEYGSGGNDMMDTWIIFGDPTLRVVGTTEPADPCDAPLGFCEEDVNDNQIVDVADILLIVDNYNSCGDGTFKPIGDVDGDCCVTVSDILAVVAAWGNDCTPIGACCLPQGGCSEAETEADCLSAGGEYKGDNSTCEFASCPSPGACCFDDGSCLFSMPSDCVDLSGAFQGDGTQCETTDCPIAGAGDECSGPLIAYTGANPFETNTATPSSPEPDEAQCSGTFLDWDGSKDIWFLYVAQASGPTHFTTCDSASYDTSMVLYEGSCDNQVACNGDGYYDTGCQSYHSEIDYTVQAGSTYYIRIGGWMADSGSGTLTID